jgi:hypothetical protein
MPPPVVVPCTESTAEDIPWEFLLYKGFQTPFTSFKTSISIEPDHHGIASRVQQLAVPF